jgi:hypothetical protein
MHEARKKSAPICSGEARDDGYGAEYIFLEAKDDVDELASFMKANEMDGAKSVHFVFANSPPEGPQASNHIAINVSGFSNGFDAFQKACVSPQ